jgi:hypothetical protein
MKRRIVTAMVYLLLAGLIVFGQWFWMRAGDDFAVVQHEGNQYKVFSWGFPLRVVDCNPLLGMATPETEIPLRVAANLFCFVGIVFVVDIVRRKLRTNDSTVPSEGAPSEVQ